MKLKEYNNAKEAFLIENKIIENIYGKNHLEYANSL
jgi:hypothetical protein